MNKKIVKNGILVLLGLVVAFVLFDFVKDYSEEKKTREEASQQETPVITEDTENDDEEKIDSGTDQEFDTTDDSEFDTADSEEVEQDEDEEAEEEVFGPYPGQIAYDFQVETIDSGEVLSLSDFRGKKVFLNFWASWCPPCRIEAPELQKFSENQDDVVVLGVNVTSSESSAENIQGFIDEFDTTFTNVYGTDEMFNLYYIESLPTSLFIDSEGVIQERVTGPVTEDSLNAHFSMFD